MLLAVKFPLNVDEILLDVFHVAKISHCVGQCSVTCGKEIAKLASSQLGFTIRFVSLQHAQQKSAHFLNSADLGRTNEVCPGVSGEGLGRKQEVGQDIV